VKAPAAPRARKRASRKLASLAPARYTDWFQGGCSKLFQPPPRRREVACGSRARKRAFRKLASLAPVRNGLGFRGLFQLFQPPPWRRESGAATPIQARSVPTRMPTRVRSARGIGRLASGRSEPLVRGTILVAGPAPHPSPFRRPRATFRWLRGGPRRPGIIRSRRERGVAARGSDGLELLLREAEVQLRGSNHARARRLERGSADLGDEAELVRDALRDHQE